MTQQESTTIAEQEQGISTRHVRPAIGGAMGSRQVIARNFAKELGYAARPGADHGNGAESAAEDQDSVALASTKAL
jgi:hypothetical protein